MSDKQLYGVAAEFADAKSLLAAAKQTREAGYRKVKAYSPYEVHGLSEVLGERSVFIPWLALGALILGAALGFWLQYGTSVLQYPLNIGGRPYNSVPAFMIITFEAGILFAGLTAFAALFISAGLPLPYHPVFNIPRFELASRSSFFLVIQATDSRFDEAETKGFLEGLNATTVSEVQL